MHISLSRFLFSLSSFFSLVYFHLHIFFIFLSFFFSHSPPTLFQMSIPIIYFFLFVLISLNFSPFKMPAYFPLYIFFIHLSFLPPPTHACLIYLLTFTYIFLLFIFFYDSPFAFFISLCKMHRPSQVLFTPLPPISSFLFSLSHTNTHTRSLSLSVIHQ